MSHLIVDKNGGLYTRSPGGGTLSTAVLPSGLTYMTARPSFSTLRRGTAIVGKYNRGGLWRDDKSKFFRIGIAAPSTPPTIAAGGTGLTAAVIGYQSFVHKEGADIIHQSNLSLPSATLTLTNQGVNWSGLATTSPDARVTHLRLWRSVDGDLPKVVTDLALGTATYSESVAYDALGGYPPVYSDGSLNVNARGIPPYCLFSCRYHGRIFYAGDPLFPHRLYYTLLDEPESVGPLAYIDTLDRDAINGLGVAGDQLMVAALYQMYELQGYSAGPTGDFVLRKVPGARGTVSHFSMVNIGGVLWWAADDGVYSFANRPQLMSENLTPFWKENYEANLGGYRNSIAIDDPYWKTYKLLIPGVNGGGATLDRSFYYVGHYGENPGAVPLWLFDTRKRLDYAMGSLSNSRGGMDLCVGGSDGYLRRENVETNTDDDGDVNQKTAIIRPKHFFFGDVSGGRSRSRAQKELTVHAKSVNQGFTVRLFVGGDQAGNKANPDWTADVPAQGDLDGSGNNISETSKLLRPTGASGKGATLEIRVTAPRGFEFRGFNLAEAPSVNSTGG